MRKIFCLETEWDFTAKKMRDKSSVQPMLTFLEQSAGVEFVFRNVASFRDLSYYIEQLQKKLYKDFQIIYLAFHGHSQLIGIPSESVPLYLSDLAKIANGVFQDKIIHLGSCRTLNTSDRIIKKFKKETGAKIVSGYTKSVDFIRSSVMDIAYFSELVDIKNCGFT